MNTKPITPIHVCDLIAHETVSLLSVLDEDAVPPAQWMRDGLALYAAAHQLVEETARHLNWIDEDPAYQADSRWAGAHPADWG